MKLLFGISLLITCHFVRASSLLLANPSFESPVIATTGTSIGGWTASSGVELVRESYTATVNTTVAGAQFVRFTGAGNTISQPVAGHLLMKGLYTLDFDVSDVFSDTVSPRPLTAKFLRADTGEILAAQTVASGDIPGAVNIGEADSRKTLSFYLPATHPAIGQGLIVRFEAGTTGGFAQTALDNLSLTHDPDAAEPALYTLNAASREERSDAALPGMSGTGADGTIYSATRNGWYRNGGPWFPVSGEFHYVRYAESEWDRELAKMKAAGIDIVATYVFWNHHEAPQGTWDWSGRKNLRRFIELASRHGLQVWLRLGPYVNAEAVNGGIPSFANTGKRSNAVGYMSLVGTYYQKVAEQVSGLCVKDGGPIVGIQLENEFASGDPKHITALKNLAIAKGMVVPFYTVTANSRFEPGTVIPLQGAYVYRGWEGSGGTAAMSGFIYGSDEWTANTDIGGTYYQTLDYPRGYCELGTGSPMGGNIRFAVDPQYVLGIAYDCVGRGSNYLGYYMFHGGTQRQEDSSASWGTSYDFQAPLGEFGQLRESGRRYRRLHTFVREFADELVPARISRDPAQIMSPSQTSRLRYIGRFSNDRGFLFLNNTQRNVTLAPRPDVRIDVRTSSGGVRFPSETLTMPVGRHNVFPFRLDLGGVDLLWATVEPMAKISHPGELASYVFWQPDWTNRELAFPAGTTIEMEVGSTTKSVVNGTLLVRTAENTRAVMRVTAPGGSSPVARVVLITDADSLQAAVHTIDGRERLVIVKGADVSSLKPSLRFEGPAESTVELDFYPAIGLMPGSGWAPVSLPGGWARFTTTLAAAPVAPIFTAAESGTWTITGNPADWASLAHAHVRLNYSGGSAQLLSGGKEITRDLYHGDSWLIDLKRFPTELAAGLSLKVNAWNSGINGVAQPAGPMPALSTTDWQPRREVAWNDADDDSLRDGWEMQFFPNLDTNATDDPDQDGLNNSREQDLGTDPTSKDSDKDGTDDRAEVRLGIDPLNPAQRFAVALSPGIPDGWQLSWPSLATCYFKIERSSNLSLWEDLEEDFPGTDGLTAYLDHPPVDASCFYRVSLLP